MNAACDVILAGFFAYAAAGLLRLTVHHCRRRI